MTFARHIRMSMVGFIGAAPGADIWQANISLGMGGEDGDMPGWLDNVLTIDATDDVWDDMRDDVVAWWLRPNSHIRSNTRLQRVKFAYIGPDGKYERPVIERDCGSIQAGEGSAAILPFQCAVAVTLGTDGDLGRVKGRFYQPSPAVDIDPNTGLFAQATADQIRDSADTLLEALGNQPGFDQLDIAPIVASQGRHNPNGSVKAPPRNYRVVRTGVGRAVDTIRSRRSKLNDAKVYVGTAT